MLLDTVREGAGAIAAAFEAEAARRPPSGRRRCRRRRRSAGARARRSPATGWSPAARASRSACRRISATRACCRDRPADTAGAAGRPSCCAARARPPRNGRSQAYLEGAPGPGGRSRRPDVGPHDGRAGRRLGRQAERHGADRLFDRRSGDGRRRAGALRQGRDGLRRSSISSAISPARWPIAACGASWSAAARRRGPWSRRSR